MENRQQQMCISLFCGLIAFICKPVGNGSLGAKHIRTELWVRALTLLRERTLEIWACELTQCYSMQRAEFCFRSENPILSLTELVNEWIGYGPAVLSVLAEHHKPWCWPSVNIVLWYHKFMTEIHKFMSEMPTYLHERQAYLPMIPCLWWFSYNTGSPIPTKAYALWSSRTCAASTASSRGLETAGGLLRI